MGRFDLIFLDVKVIQAKIKSKGGLKHTSQKLILAKILNKGPFFKVQVVGAYLRVGAYSKEVLV